MAPEASTAFPRKGATLSNFKRTFSTPTVELDHDSDEMLPSEWPPTQRPLPLAQARPVPTAYVSTKPAHGMPSAKPATAARPLAQASSRAGSAPPPVTTHKRQFPWDAPEASDKRAKTESKTAFHQLATAPGTEAGPSKARPGSASLAKRSTANIRQRVVLSPEQQEVLRIVVDEGKSVFFTGSAGTGKSVLLREIIASLTIKHKKRNDAVSVTASTGMAACNIGGSTIHSFAGIGLGMDPVETLVARIMNPKNRKAADRWRRTLVLVIDEVSMVDGQLFDKLDGIARKVRKKPDQPFGGMQLVVTGDFFQLPPVMKGSGSAKYAFEASAWNEAIEHTVNLTQVFRQKDTTFVDMLNELRFGQLSAKSISKFTALRRPVAYDDGIEPTQLCALRNEVDRANNDRLVRIKTSVRDFLAIDEADGMETEARKKLLDNLLAPEKLSLKPGAQVMYLKNSPDLGLVNGTLGKVVRFAPPGHIIEEEAFDADGGGGEMYEDGDGMLRRVVERKPTPKPPGVKIERSDKDVPWVEWNVPNKLVTPVAREVFKIEQHGQVKAKRTQFPLILSWAVSIHKSQGQTLDRVKVDLSKIFESGQAYVALSRATSMERLEVTGFNPAKVTVNRKVLEWNKTLQTLS